MEDTENPRWLLLYSQFRGICGIVDISEVRTGKKWEEAFSPFDYSGALIRGAVALVPSEEFIVSGVSIDWGEDDASTDGESKSGTPPRPPRRRPRRQSEET